MSSLLKGHDMLSNIAVLRPYWVVIFCYKTIENIIINKVSNV